LDWRNAAFSQSTVPKSFIQIPDDKADSLFLTPLSSTFSSTFSREINFVNLKFSFCAVLGQRKPPVRNINIPPNQGQAIVNLDYGIEKPKWLSFIIKNA